MAKKLLFVVNTPEFFISHRAPLALAAKKEGYSVHVACSKGKAVKDIKTLGFTYHEVHFDRSGQNPLTEIKTLFYMYFLLKKVRPTLIHLVTIKPVLYGGIVNRLFYRVPFVAAVSGLGTVFTSVSIFGRLRRLIVKMIYKLALGYPLVRVIFQNPDDKNMLVKTGVVNDARAELIRGAGVDLKEYKKSREPKGDKIKVVMAARLLKEKGVYEFYKAAKLLEYRNVPVKMKLIGTPDQGNPRSLSDSEFNIWKEESFIEVLGFRKDIASQYAKANIVCLPSYYGEGLPKSLIEAAACGRAVITTDSPGCNYAIENGVTGLLVPPRDHIALADAIEELVVKEDKRKQMGEAGRVFAEKHFDINMVVKQHLAIYEELLSYE